MDSRDHCGDREGEGGGAAERRRGRGWGRRSLDLTTEHRESPPWLGSGDRVGWDGSRRRVEELQWRGVGGAAEPRERSCCRTWWEGSLRSGEEL